MLPGDDLTEAERDALAKIPETLGAPGVRVTTLNELVRRGYAERVLGGIVLTLKGRLSKSQRA